MADLRECVEAEFENLNLLIKNLPAKNMLSGLSSLELGGVAALVHNFYNGIENILKQMTLNKHGTLPDSATWHRDLLEGACTQGFISSNTAERLDQYLGFRHFFSH